MKIYVGNLAYSVTEDELRTAFAEYGEVDTVNLIIDRGTGQSKGFGFIEMSDDNAASEAIGTLNGQSLNGRNIKVNEAKPREQRPDRGPRY